MKPIVFSALLLASLLQAQTEPGVFPADRDGAPPPLAPVDGVEKGPRRDFGRPVRDKIAQLKDAGITREDMQKIKAALEKARDDESVKAAREKADVAQEKLRVALRAYAESKGVQLPEQGAIKKFRQESGNKPELTPEQMAERRARKQGQGQEGAARKPEISPDKMAEIRKVMEGARNDPAVKAAFEETRAAGEALRAAVHAAMLKSDPSLAPLIEKLGDLREVFREEHPGLGLRREGAHGPEGKPRGEKPQQPQPEPGNPAGA